ncbi:MAG: AsmA family protein [Roseiarcus sp.]
MRAGLTVLAIILILTLTTALIGPYFVDWNGQRALIEAQLGRVLGMRVTVRGDIDLKLLPTPFITLNRVEVGNPQAGGPIFSCSRIELSLGIASLARGEFRFTQAAFAEPSLDLARGSDGRIALPRIDLAERSDSIAFDKVVVRDGRLRVAQAGGAARLDIGGIDLDAEAASLLGPFRGAGAAAGPGGAKIAFSFSSGPIEGGGLRLKSVISAGPGLPRGEFDGAVTLAAATPTSGAAVVGYAGAAVFTGVVGGAAGPAPWRAAGALKANLSEASLADLDVRIGPEDRALAATGSARAQFGAAPQMSVVLAAKQLNLDAALRAEGEESSTPSQAFAALNAALAGLATGGGPPVALSLELSTPAAILGGDTVADVSLAATAKVGAPILGRLEASPPGRGHILATGTVEFGSAPGFSGRLDASVGDARRFRDWLASGAPDLAARLAAVGEVLPYRSASLVGDVDLSAAGFAARNLSLVLERSTFTGSLAATRAAGAERARLFMDLQTDSLDIDSLPNMGASGDLLSDVDLSLTLDARAIHVARLGEGQVDSGSLTLALTKTSDDWRLDRFSIADLGGASVEATGAIDARTRRLSAKVDAARLRDFAALVRRVAPGAMSDLLVGRAGYFSPARLTFSAVGQGSGGDAAPFTITVDGTVGVTRLGAKLDQAAGGALNAAVTLDAPDAAPLLRQIGLPALSLVGKGASHIGGALHGRWGEALDGEFSASLAGAELAWRGRLTRKPSDDDGAQVEGAATFKASDAAPLLAVLGVAPPEGSPVVPVEMSAATTWRGGRLDLAQLRGAAGRARFTGALSYRPAAAANATPIADPDVALARSIAGEDSSPAAPQLEGELSVDHLSLAALTGLALGAPQPAKAGAAWSDARFGAGLVDPPTAAIRLEIAALDITDRLFAHDAAVRLGLGRGVLNLEDVSMRVAGGAVGGHATIRRDGPSASLSGEVSIEPIAVDRPDFTGRLSGAMNFATSGQSAAALVAGVAGTGRIRLAGARIPRLDQDALGRIIDRAQSSDYPIDQTNVAHALDVELGKQALALADGDAPAALTAGVVRVGPFEARAAWDDALVRADFDLRSFTLEIRAALTQLRTPKYWSGAPPSISVMARGSGEASVREIDSSLFVAGLAAQAIARETERIAALESDIRERAFFNRRLKADEALRRRELELDAFAIEQARLRSEADRRRIEGEALRAEEEKRAALAPQLSASPPPSGSPPAVQEPEVSKGGAGSTTDPPALTPLRRPDPTAGGLY